MQSHAEDTLSRIGALASSVGKQGPSAIALEGLSELQDKYKGIMDQMDDLLKSLHINDQAYDVQGDLLYYLICARDLKINIRQKAIGMFFEWDRLDQASGGINPALGRLRYLFSP